MDQGIFQISQIQEGNEGPGEHKVGDEFSLSSIMTLSNDDLEQIVFTIDLDTSEAMVSTGSLQD